MITLIPSSKKSIFTKSFVLLLILFLLHHKAQADPENPNEIDPRYRCKPVVVLEKNTADKKNNSEIVTIHNSTNHSFTIEGTTTYYIFVDHEGYITDDNITASSTHCTLTYNTNNSSPGNPIKITLNDPILPDSNDTIRDEDIFHQTFDQNGEPCNLNTLPSTSFAENPRPAGKINTVTFSRLPTSLHHPFTQTFTTNSTLDVCAIDDPIAVIKALDPSKLPTIIETAPFIPDSKAFNTSSFTKLSENKKERVEERIYRMGYSKIIFRVFPRLKKTEITFVDERLSIIINEDKSKDESNNNPENNPAQVAEYIDAIAMEPIVGIPNADGLIDILDAPTLNRDAEIVRQAILDSLNEDIPSGPDPSSEPTAFVQAPSPTPTPSKAAALKATLNLLHPAKFADIDPIIFNNHSLLYSNICHHFDEICCQIKPDCCLNIWGKAFGNFQTRKTNSLVTGYHAFTSGMFVGLDCCPVNPLCCGAGFAFTCDDIRWKEEEANAVTNSFYGFLYTALNCQYYFVRLIGSVSYSEIDGNRFINIGTNLNRKTNHKNHAITCGGRLNTGLNLYLPCQLILQVFDSFDLGNVDTSAFTESGGISQNLHVNKRSSLHLRNELGFQLSRTYLSPCENTCWTPMIGLSWIYQNPLTGHNMTVNAQGRTNQFTVRTRKDITNQISPQASLTVNSISGIYLSTYYNGAFSKAWSSNEVSVHMGKNF